MDNINKVKITFLVADKSGVLSSILITGDLLGLVFRKQTTTKLETNNSRIKVYFDGEFNCNRKESISRFEEHPKVIKVEKIEVVNDDETINENNDE